MELKRNYFIVHILTDFDLKQGPKRSLDTPKRMIKRRERERKVQGEIYHHAKIITGNYQLLYIMTRKMLICCNR